MKRDFELIREILLETEANEQGFAPYEISGWTLSEVQYHHRLMVDAGLLEQPQHCHPRLARRIHFPPRITWKGHNFLDDARDERVWNEALRRIRRVAATVSIGVLTQVLIDVVKEGLGIGS